MADQCRQAWGSIKPIMPAVGGRIGIERIGELGSVLGRDAIFVLGSRMQQNPENIVAAMNALHRALTESF